MGDAKIYKGQGGSTRPRSVVEPEIYHAEHCIGIAETGATRTDTIIAVHDFIRGRGGIIGLEDGRYAITHGRDVLIVKDPQRASEMTCRRIMETAVARTRGAVIEASSISHAALRTDARREADLMRKRREVEGLGTGGYSAAEADWINSEPFAVPGDRRKVRIGFEEAGDE